MSSSASCFRWQSCQILRQMHTQMQSFTGTFMFVLTHEYSLFFVKCKCYPRDTTSCGTFYVCVKMLKVSNDQGAKLIKRPMCLPSGLSQKFPDFAPFRLPQFVRFQFGKRFLQTIPEVILSEEQWPVAKKNDENRHLSSYECIA